MISKQTMIDQFQIAVNDYPNVEVIRKRLLKVCSTNGDTALASERAYDILFKSDYKMLLLDTWEKIKLIDLTNTASVQVIRNGTQYTENNVQGAISEATDVLPVETINIVRELYTDQAPFVRVATMIFIVATITLRDHL